MRTRLATTRSPLPDRRGQWLYALMMIAATAVIVLSLLGIARMTGFWPRIGSGPHETDTARDKQRGIPKEREDSAPESQRPSPGTGPAARSPRRLVDCARCGDVDPVRSIPQIQGHSRAGAAVVGLADIVSR